MQLNLTQASGQEFTFSASLPPDYNGPVLRGGNVLSATDPNIGKVVQQELINSHYAIRLNVFEFVKPFQLQAFQTGYRLVSFLALKNNLHYHIEGVGTVHLKQGQFALLHTSGHPAVAQFKKTKPHECFEISWTDTWLRPLLDKFEFLKPLFEPAGIHSSFILDPHPRPAGAMALDMARNILSTPFDADTSRLLFETQAHAYLLLLLVEAAKKENPLVSITDREREIIATLGKEVQDGYDRKFKLSTLSRRAGMSVTKFKEAFREIFGKPMGVLHMEARMHEARRLLIETSLSTKEIKDKVGYELTTSFLSQFHDFFGYWPNDLRKKGK